jgi:hypothetical protein
MLTFGVGGTIYIRGGTYNSIDRTPIPAGNASSWTRIRRYPGEQVVFDGKGKCVAPFSAQATVPAGAYGLNAGYVEIHGIKGINHSVWGILVSYVGGSNFLIRNCTAINSSSMVKFGANWDSVNNTVSIDNITIQNCKWIYNTASFIGSISGNILTVTSISDGYITPNMGIVGNGVSGYTRIAEEFTGPWNGTGTGGVGTYTLNLSQTVASTAISGSYCSTVFDFGPAPCSNISVDSVSIVRNNAVPTGDTAADGMALERGGPFTANKIYVVDVDGDCIDMKCSTGNASLTNAVGIQRVSGRNVFKAWPGTGATATMQNCFAYRYATVSTIQLVYEMIALANTPGSQILRRCTIINNNANGQNLIGYMTGTQATTVKIQGCTIAATNAANNAVLIDIGAPTTSGTLVDWKYNRFYSNRTDAVVRFPAGIAYSAAQFNAGTFDTDFSASGMVNNLSQLPSFVDATNANFRLLNSDSVAANRYLTNDGLANDLDGNAGLYGVYQDIGAFELQANTVVPPTISTLTIPSGAVNSVYNTSGFQFLATGTGSITWSVVSGSATLTTAGLSLSSSGLLSGTCAAVVSAPITVRATDSVGSADRTVTLTITPDAALFATRVATIDKSNTGTAKTITSDTFNMQSGDVLVFFVSHVTPNAVGTTLPTATLSNGGTVNALSTIGGSGTVARWAMGRIFTYTASGSISITISANSNQTDLTYDYGQMSIRGAVYRPYTGKALSIVGTGSKSEQDYIPSNSERSVSSPGTITNIGVVASFYAIERTTNTTQSVTQPSGFTKFGTETYVSAADYIMGAGFNDVLTWIHNSASPFDGNYYRSLIGAVAIQQSA